MQRKYLLFIVLLIAGTMAGCKSGGDITKGDEAYAKEQYATAIDIYKSAYGSTKDKAKRALIAYKIADAMQLIRSYTTSEGWYRKAISMGYSDPKVYYYLGEALKMNEKYDEAIIEFENYKKEAPSDERTDKQIEVVKNILAFKENPRTRFIVETFKPANSSANDFAAVPYKKDGIIFTSDREIATGKKTFGRTGLGYEDLFLIDKQKKGRSERWIAAVPLEGEVNTDLNEGTPAFDDRGSVMYYTQCNPTKENSKDEMPNCVIMMARKKGKGWGDPEKLPFCNDTTIDYGQPALSPDGTKMIFSMDGPYGKGKHDLYLSTYVKRSRTWSDPVNLGDVINTPENETFPYFKDDTTLYFSSDGHIGIGGLDVFVSYGKGTEWSEPKHLDYPLNSGGDDFAIVFTGKESGMFSSNRPKSRGDDIYTFTMTPLVITLEGNVIDSFSRNPVKGATVTLINTYTKQKRDTIVDSKGHYLFDLKPGYVYQVYSSKKFYFNSKTYDKSTVGIEQSTTLYQDLVLTPPEITLKGVYYDLNKADLRPESQKTLDSVVDVLKTYPFITVELGSHTDCRASMAYNDSLSQARSNSVVNYLVQHGIETDRLVAKGYGERQLVNNCACEPNNVGPGKDCTEEEHQANRRTTLKVLSWTYVPKKKEEGTGGDNNNNGGDNNNNGGEGNK